MRTDFALGFVRMRVDFGKIEDYFFLWKSLKMI